jgi:nucleotide-binding universal stress UspA family protein
MEESYELNYRPARQILITIDGSNAAEKAADFGKEIAGLSGAKVYAVYVSDISFLDSVPMDDPLIRDMFEQFEKTGLEATSYIEKTAKDAGLEAEYILLKGNPAKEILNFAEKQKIDMIVAGSIGKSGVEHFTLGSTSEKVVRHAKSFICVKPPEKQEIKNVILKWDNKIMGEWD